MSKYTKNKPNLALNKSSEYRGVCVFVGACEILLKTKKREGAPRRRLRSMFSLSFFHFFRFEFRNPGLFEKGRAASSFLVHYGGQEAVLLAPGVSTERRARRAARSGREQFSFPIVVGNDDDGFVVQLVLLDVSSSFTAAGGP
jgi:hypothetical protein